MEQCWNNSLRWGKAEAMQPLPDIDYYCYVMDGLWDRVWSSYVNLWFISGLTCSAIHFSLHPKRPTLRFGGREESATAVVGRETGRRVEQAFSRKLN